MTQPVLHEQHQMPMIRMEKRILAKRKPQKLPQPYQELLVEFKETLKIKINNQNGQSEEIQSVPVYSGASNLSNINSQSSVQMVAIPDSEEQELLVNLKPRKSLGNQKETVRFCERYAPMKLNPIIHNWVKQNKLCSGSRLKYNELYRNRLYFFMILGQLERADGGRQLKRFHNDFSDLKNHQIQFLCKTYTNEEMAIFKNELDYLEQSLRLFVEGYPIQDVFKVAFGRGKTLKGKRKKAMEQAITKFNNQYSFQQ